MRARRTPWWYYLVAAVIGLALGVSVVKIAETTGISLLGAPWFVAIAMALIGAVTLYLSWQVHSYLKAEPDKRKSWYDPKRAMFTLVLAKALALAGAGLAGWYLSQMAMVLSHAEAPYFRSVAIQCAVTGCVCLADMVIGIVGEGMCQIPPQDGPEHPRTKARRRSEIQSVAQKGSK